MSLLRRTGIPALISFYRYFAFNLPRSTLAAGMGLLAALGLVQGYLAATSQEGRALAVVFGLLAAGALVGAAALPLGRPWTWALGSAVSVAALAVWVLTRTFDLVGVRDTGEGWDNPAGTFSMAAAALFVGLCLSVVTGMNVVAPRRRKWTD